MKIIQVEDYYINKLMKAFPTIMDPKRFHRSHTRKYLGVIFTINSFTYYAPFSSPKPNDYRSDGSIKPSSFFGVKMTKDGKPGEKVLLGTIKLNNMIPIPLKYVIGYSIDNEPDANYKNVVSDEFKWISENQGLIVKNALKLYHFKNNEVKNRNVNNAKQYDAVLPFKDIEQFLIDNNLL